MPVRTKSDVRDLFAQLGEDQYKQPGAQRYAFNQSKEGRHVLRQMVRGLHRGQDARNCPHNAPIAYMMAPNNENRYSYAVRNSNKQRYDFTRNKPMASLSSADVAVFDIEDINRRQQEVDVIYDRNKITAQQIRDIQDLKAGNRINLPHGMTFKDYEKQLIDLGSHVVVRGEVMQHFTMNSTGDALPEPRKQVCYYANFPKLQGREPTADMDKFCVRSHRRNLGGNEGTWEIRDFEGLKAKYKEVLRLQIVMAAKHGEALDQVTPNAFLYALTNEYQDEARKLFAEAICELATDPSMSQHPFDSFKGLFVHGDGHDVFSKHLNAIMSQSNTHHFPVYIHDRDSMSLSQACADAGLSELKVAVCLMGEATGPVGNGALGGRAEKAMEENFTRQAPELYCILSPKWNERLLDERLYEAFDMTALTNVVHEEDEPSLIDEFYSDSESTDSDVLIPQVDDVNDSEHSDSVDQETLIFNKYDYLEIRVRSNSSLHGMRPVFQAVYDVVELMAEQESQWRWDRHIVDICSALVAFDDNEEQFPRSAQVARQHLIAAKQGIDQLLDSGKLPDEAVGMWTQIKAMIGQFINWLSRGKLSFFEESRNSVKLADSTKILREFDPSSVSLRS